MNTNKSLLLCIWNGSLDLGWYLLDVHALLHEQLVVLVDIAATFEFIMDVAEEVQGTNWTLGGGLQAGLDASRMEVVEAKEGSDLVIGTDVVVADGTLPGLAAVLGLEQVGPIAFDGVCIVALGVDSEVDDAFLHEHTAVNCIGGVFSDEARDEVAGPSVAFELKLCLDESEYVAIALDLPTHPALPDLDLVLVAFDSDFPC